MFNIQGTGIKIALAIALILSIIGLFKFQSWKIEKFEKELQEKELKLKQEKENNKLIHEAYEKTLAIEKEIADQKLQAQEQKEVVVVKYKTLEKELEKRGEIKQDENSNFTIVSF